MGQKRVIAETGAGQHGVALATAAANVGLQCDRYMGAVDIKKQAPNVARMKILGANVVEVTHGQATLKEAVDAAFVNTLIKAGYEPKTIDLLVEIMAEVKTSTKKNYSINGSPIPLAKIQERYQDIDMFHVTHILDNLRTLAKDIKNPRAYIRSMLFNVPVTMDAQITSQVNRDNADRVGVDVPTGGHGLGPAEIENLRRTANTPIDDMGDDEE